MNQADSARMLRELLDFDGEGAARPLRGWEISFIDSLKLRLDHHRGFLTPAQQAKLAEIWEGVFG